MPNTWSYHLLLGSRDVTSAAIDAALMLAEERGYALSLPSVVFTNEGSEVEYVEREALFEGLAEHGGLVSLWNEPELAKRTILLQVMPAECRLGYGTVNDFRAETRDERRRLVGDLEALFVGLCRTLRPLYGYSTDEWRLESVFEDPQAALDELSRRTRGGELPNVLFWLNYFDAAYWREIGEARLWLGAKCRPVEGGVLVQLADDPSNAFLATLGGDGRYHPA